MKKWSTFLTNSLYDINHETKHHKNTVMTLLNIRMKEKQDEILCNAYLLYCKINSYIIYSSKSRIICLRPVCFLEPISHTRHSYHVKIRTL